MAFRRKAKLLHLWPRMYSRIEARLAKKTPLHKLDFAKFNHNALFFSFRNILKKRKVALLKSNCFTKTFQLESTYLSVLNVVPVVLRFEWLTVHWRLADEWRLGYCTWIDALTSYWECMTDWIIPRDLHYQRHVSLVCIGFMVYQELGYKKKK